MLDIKGAQFGPIYFTPVSIPGMAPNPKFLNEELSGIKINILDRNNYDSYFTGIALIKYFHDIDTQNFKWQQRHFDRLCGTDKIRKFISEGKDLQEIKIWLDEQKNMFLLDRQRFLLY